MCLDITVKVMDWTITHGEIEIYIHTQITQMSHISFLASLFVLTFILIDYFRTEWRSVSTQAVMPPEPKVDKGMHSASGRIHRVGLFKYIAAVKLLLFVFYRKGPSAAGESVDLCEHADTAACKCFTFGR